MKFDLITRWGKVYFVFPLFLLTVGPLPLPTAFAQQPLQNAMTTLQNPADFIPPDFFYFSVFASYQGYMEEAVTSWPEANAHVGRIGGWRSYAEEASQPDPSDQQVVIPEQPLTSPLIHESDKHSGHGGKP